MGWGNISLPGRSFKVYLRMVWFRGMGYCVGDKITGIMDPGKMVLQMGMEKCLKIIITIKDYSKMEKCRVMEFINTKMEIFIKVISKITKDMDPES